LDTETAPSRKRLKPHFFEDLPRDPDRAGKNFDWLIRFNGVEWDLMAFNLTINTRDFIGF
jgi:hypothetical protein